ncbi:MAG TPA: NADP-dependent oxidoreductase [Methylomirabilota bacterium]|nr:NADP-dependent oxidoreductase [Methylomirabilota bacterium]
MPRTHRQVRLAARPVGCPKESDFRLVECPVPEPGAGAILVRVIYLSLDPYMRGRMSDVRSYVPPVAIGDVMEGGTVGEVVHSNNPGFSVGDIVESRLGWQEYAVSAGKGVRKIDPTVAPISTALGVLGMPGLTAYFGLLEVGQPKPGETVVVSAASGAVGGLVGQIAKLQGCRAVGLAGSNAKVDYITGELGYDAGINYRTAPDLDAALRATCPDGVDVYFDNVGGRITEAVSRHVNVFARVAVCGLISQYNLAEPELAPRNERFVLVNRVRIQGFIVLDFAARYREALRQLTEWVQQGKLKYREDIVDGLEHAPGGLIGLLQGKNFGKMLVRVGPSPVRARAPEARPGGSGGGPR